jgi:quercetin dioxygenase-like cupin family protein
MNTYRISLLAFLACWLGAAGASAQQPPGSPQIIKPDALTYAGPPQIPALGAAWAIGSEKGPGLYALRVKLRSGGIIPPHTHPDARITTVLAGSLLIGFADTVDEKRAVVATAGDSYLVPAGTPHFIVARGADVEYQEMGSGGTGTEMLKH